MVDLGFEADAWWLEGVVFGESNVNLEVAALVELSVLLETCKKMLLDKPGKRTRLGLA